MPDPKSLKIGNRVCFTSLPDEWSRKGYTIQPESIRFMKVLIKRKRSARVAQIDEHGCPWIHARIRVRGILHHHSWAIVESTGWRLVKSRK